MKRDWNSRTAILLLGGILVFINIIGLNLFGRIDLTDDKVYSLSDASIDLIENLEDPVTFTAFFTDNLPAPYSANRRFLKDKLDDYRAYGGQNVQYKFVDPVNDETLEEEANRFRIPPVQIQVIESDNLQLKNAYMGLAIQYGAERETIPVVQDLSTLEYDITSAVRRLTRENLPTAGFLSGHGEPAPQSMQTFYEQLSRNYTPQVVTINDSLPVLSTTPELLFIVAPTDTFPDLHLRAIDAYVMNGGRLAVFLNRISANMQMGQASIQSVGLEDLLRSYGAGVGDNLVMDQQSSPITMQRQQGLFTINQQVEYPFLPVSNSFNEESIVVSRLSNVMMFFVSAIDASLGVPEEVVYTPLIYSSTQSQLQEGFFMIQPGMPGQDNLSGGPYTLAASYAGSFPSAYESGKKSTDTRIILVGDGDFINESMVGPIPGNIELALNTADWLAQDDALLSIRSKKIEPRTLRETSEEIRPLIKYANMFGPVLFIVFFGLMRWRNRKSRQIVLQK